MRKYKLLAPLLLVSLVVSSVPAKAETEGIQDTVIAESEANNESSQTEGTQYLGIASVSKVYVTTAVMQLADQGLVDIDAPVTEYIPDFKLADERYKDITVRMLMNHTSGLMGSVYGGGFIYNEASMEYHDNLLKILSTERLKYTPGEYNCYCNDGFTLLEILVERVSKMSFTDYVEKNIATPMGLDKTKTMWSIESFEDMVPYYMNGNIKMDTECTQLIGSGGMITDAKDLCTFGSAFYKGNEVLLSEHAKKQMEENQAAGLSRFNFGLGWDQVIFPEYEAAGVKVLQKGGDTSSYHSSLTVAPEEMISVAVISSGGSSSVNGDIALELMEIALEEKGIEIKHPEKKEPEIVDTIPEEIKVYEGQYLTSGSLVDICFPNDSYMLVRALSQSNPFEMQYVYSQDGRFVKVSGDVESGNAIVVKPVQALKFESADGRDFIVDEDGDFQLERVTEVSVSDSVKNAWNNRNGVRYYLISENCNSGLFVDQACVTLDTYDEVGEYVNDSVMIDENHAENRINIPSSASRDLSDMEITEKDGCEILSLTAWNMAYISEKNIPEYSSDITEVETTQGNAVWYRINGVQNETVRLDIPENAAVYVFDKFGNVKYSSYMKDYGNCVPLPENGMIVFMGDTGAKIGISR